MRGNSTIWSSAVHGTQCRNPEHHPTGKGSTTKGKATTGTSELSSNGESMRRIVIRFFKLIYTQTWLLWKHRRSSLFDDSLSQTLKMNLTGYPNAIPLIRKTQLNPRTGLIYSKIKYELKNKTFVCPLFIGTSVLKNRSRWLCGPKFRSAAARLLDSRVRILLGAWNFVSSLYCVLCR